MQQPVCRWVTATEDCEVKARGRKMVTCGLCCQWRTLPHVVPLRLARAPWKWLCHLRRFRNVRLFLNYSYSRLLSFNTFLSHLTWFYDRNINSEFMSKEQSSCRRGPTRVQWQSVIVNNAQTLLNSIHFTVQRHHNQPFREYTNYYSVLLFLSPIIFHAVTSKFHFSELFCFVSRHWNVTMFIPTKAKCNNR